MKIHRIVLSPAHFGSMPGADRGLLVLLGHILNDVNALNKLLACSARIEPGSDWLVHAGSCQAFLFAKTLVGKLSEAWTAIQDGYFRSKLCLQYDQLLVAPAPEGLAKLKAYFGKANLVSAVRNGFAFHYSFEQAKILIPLETTSEELVLYLHQQVGNSLYQFSEFAMNRALLDGIEPNNLAGAMNRLLSELNNVVGWLNDFAQGAMIAILHRHVGADALHHSSTEIELPDVPMHTDVKIPFFIEFPFRSARLDDA